MSSVRVHGFHAVRTRVNPRTPCEPMNAREPTRVYLIVPSPSAGLGPPLTHATSASNPLIVSAALMLQWPYDEIARWLSHGVEPASATAVAYRPSWSNGATGSRSVCSVRVGMLRSPVGLKYL